MNIVLSSGAQQSEASITREIKDLEEILQRTVDSSKPHQVEQQIADLLPYVGKMPQLVGLAKWIHGEALKQVAASVIKDPELLKLKDNIQRQYINGEMSRYNALYEKITTMKSAVDKSIDGLRSILSFEKSLIQNSQ